MSRRLSRHSCKRTISLYPLSSASPNLSAAGCCGHTKDVKRKKRKAKRDQKVVSEDPQLLGCESRGLRIVSKPSHHLCTISGVLLKGSVVSACFLLLLPMVLPHIHSLPHLYTNLDHGPAHFHPFLSSPLGSIPFSNDVSLPH